MTDRLLTTREVAELLGVSTETVVRWWRRCPERASLSIIVAGTGLRPEEWLALERRDLDLKAGTRIESNVETPIA